jgi:hypothetical protein
MGTTYYYTVNDEIIGEHTLGQSRLDYVTDALGSVIARVDQTLTVQSTARYKPYGALLSQTGTQPKYGWVGSPGYRKTGSGNVSGNWPCPSGKICKPASMGLPCPGYYNAVNKSFSTTFGIDMFSHYLVKGKVSIYFIVSEIPVAKCVDDPKIC